MKNQKKNNYGVELPIIPLSRRVCRRELSDSEEHLADHCTHSTGQPNEEAMESAGRGECERFEAAGGGAGARGFIPHERHGGGQDIRHDDAEYDGLRSKHVSQRNRFLYV